jgi:signal transduction histidine kinase
MRCILKTFPVLLNLMRGHGGQLWAEANEPRGTIFQFTLPAVAHE